MVAGGYYGAFAVLSMPQSDGDVYERDACPLRCCLTAVAYRCGATCWCADWACAAAAGSRRCFPRRFGCGRWRHVASGGASRCARKARCYAAAGADSGGPAPRGHKVACWRGPLFRGVPVCTTHAVHANLTVALSMMRSACVSLAPLSFCSVPPLACLCRAAPAGSPLAQVHAAAQRRLRRRGRPG